MTPTGFAIIGCGNIGPVHAASIAQTPGAKLIAVCDINENTAQELAAKYNAIPFTNYKTMLERGDIHAVSLCVPSGLRAEIAVACAQAGKHILSEKPLEVNTKRIDRVIGAADEAGVLLGCIFQYRFAQGPQHLRKAIEQGRFGKLVLGDAHIKWYRSPEYYRDVAWRGTKKLDGGGVLINQGIHQIDLLLWFMGPVKTVRAQTKCIAHEYLEVEDLATATLEFENGALGVIEGTTAVWPGHPGRVEILGTEGSAILEDGQLKAWNFKKRRALDGRIEAEMHKDSELGSGAGDPMSGLKIEGHLRQIKDFVRAIRKGQEPSIDGREGRNAVHLIEKIYQSARTGRTVKV